MDIKTFYKLYRKKSLEEKMELIYKTAWIMSCDAFSAGRDEAYHNRDDYEYEQKERYAMKARLRWLCWQVIEDSKEII